MRMSVWNSLATMSTCQHSIIVLAAQADTWNPVPQPVGRYPVRELLAISSWRRAGNTSAVLEKPHCSGNVPVSVLFVRFSCRSSVNAPTVAHPAGKDPAGQHPLSNRGPKRCKASDSLQACHGP